GGNLPAETGMAVPDGYFESFEERLKAKMQKPEPKVIQFKSYRKYWVSAVSAAAILLLTFSLFGPGNNELGFDDLAKGDIEAYFENKDIELNEYEIAQVIPVDELEVQDLLDDNIDREQLMDYLDESLEDIDDLNFSIDE
ncbi:hypothetical protein, partial [Zeaxanthinibacter enoshimensis]|uniref:hypothetical protein n=1 Tax=Zeaxanthinibacter enoshimensis TaxID=392009 RepID=UPI0035641847